MIRAGVCCHLGKIPNLATGTTVNLVYDTGQRHFLSCHPNNAALAFESLDLRPLASADHLLRCDIWFSDSMLYGGNEKLFRATREAGVPVSVDLNWDPKWGHAPAEEIARRKEAIRRLLPLVDVAHGNIRELGEFAGEQRLEASLTRLLEWGVGAVVVHMGTQGAGYFSGRELVIEPPAPIERRLMATGTGDVLSVCMVLLHRRADISIPEKLRLANRIVAGFIEGRRALLPSL